MHTHGETLKILNCSKSTLSRYVNKGKLKRVKRGRETFYDEREVALLVQEIEDNKQRVGIEIKQPEKIELPPEIENEIQLLSANSKLTRIGMEVLSTATSDLVGLGLYEDCDKQTLLCYALSAQAYNHYYAKSIEADSVSMNGEIVESKDGTVQVYIGKATVHPYHNIMMDHQKMMLQYSDRLGLNPLARQKLNIKEKPKIDEMDGLIDE